MTDTMTKAVAYIRASTEEQQATLSAQAQRCQHYCAFKELELVREFVDSGTSATVPFAHRQSAVELLTFCREHEIRQIIVSKLDRAFRDTVDCLLTVAKLQEHGYGLHILDVDLDTTTANGQFFVTIMAAMAQWELKRRAERQKEALAVMRSQGLRLGQEPYGWTAHQDPSLGVTCRENVRAKLAPHEEEQSTLIDIFHWRANGMGCGVIARRLNEDGISTKTGRGRWHKATVQSVIRTGRLSDGTTFEEFTEALAA